MRRILFIGLIVGLTVGLLNSCGGAQPATQDNASRGDSTGEETTSLDESLTSGGTTESTTTTTVAQSPELSRNTPTGPAVGTSGMLSSTHPLATQADLDVLQEGGNAFDAALAVAAASNVVNPYMSGIGG